MGLIDSLFNIQAQQDANDANISIARLTNQANWKLASQQNAFNYRLWNEANAYNTPQKQVERFKDAGLSAAASAQAAAGIPAQPLQSAELANQQLPAPQVAPRIDFGVESLLNIARQLEALKSDKLGNQMKEQDAVVHNRMVLSDADAKEWMVDRLEQQYHQSAAMFPYSVLGMQADSQLKRSQSDYYGELRNKIEADTARIKQDFEFLKDYNELKKKELNEQINNVLEERKKIRQDTATSKSQQDLNAALKGSAESQKEAQDLQNLLTTHGFPDSVAMRASVMLSEGKLDLEKFWDYLDKIKYYNKSGQQYLDDPETIAFLHEIYDEGRARRGDKNPTQMAPWLDTIEGLLGIPPFR